MPVFEQTYQAQGKNKAGKQVAIHPKRALQQLGPCLQVVVTPMPEHLDALAKKGEQPPKPVLGLAIIDTGATSTAVDEETCKKLGISPTGQRKTSHAGGEEIRACYPIQIAFPGTPLPPMRIPMAMSVNLQGDKNPYVILVGREVLSNMKLVYNGPQGRIEIAY